MSSYDISQQASEGSTEGPGATLSLADLLGLPPEPSDGLGVKICCAALYQLDPVRLLLGDTLHPGGPELTRRLCRLAGLKEADLVLDVACGPGASAITLAESTHSRVVGVDLGKRTTADARRRAKEKMVDSRVSLLCGDAEQLPLRSGSFDGVLCECSLSLFPDKLRGVAEMTRLLRPGCTLAVSDVSVEPGRLPDELKGNLGRILCLADALPVGGYRELLDSGGLTLVLHEDASDSLMDLLEGIRRKLAAYGMFLGTSGTPGNVSDLIPRALPILEEVKVLVEGGAIGYWLFVAEKR